MLLPEFRPPEEQDRCQLGRKATGIPADIELRKIVFRRWKEALCERSLAVAVLEPLCEMSLAPEILHEILNER